MQPLLSRMLATVSVAAMLLALPATAWSASDGDWHAQARALEASTWTVEVVGERRTRQLRLGRATDLAGTSGRIEAWYGWSDALRQPVAATLALDDGHLVLRLVTPARSALELTVTGSRTLEGSFVPRDGAVRDARLTRSDGPDGPPPAPAASAGGARAALQQVHMVYMGGNDCPPCRWWLANDLVQLQQSPVFQQIRFSHVNKTVRSAVPPVAFLPEEVRPLKAQLDDANGGMPGSAQVAVFVGGRLHDYYFGTRTAPEVLAMLDAIATGAAAPQPRCLQIGTAGRCLRRAP